MPEPTTAPASSPPTSAQCLVPSASPELISFLASRSLPCPRCAYDLRDIQTPICPECGEPLFLTVGSAKPRFGWLILAMAPGCFSGVAACFLFIPIVMHFWWGNLGKSSGMPWPFVFADLFGFASAASVLLMYKHRRRLMGWPDKAQRRFAAAIWATHILAFVTLWGSMWVFYR